MAIMAQSHNKVFFNENVEDYTFVLPIKVSDENDNLHKTKMKMHKMKMTTYIKWQPT